MIRSFAEGQAIDSMTVEKVFPDQDHPAERGSSGREGVPEVLWSEWVEPGLTPWADPCCPAGLRMTPAESTSALCSAAATTSTLPEPPRRRGDDVHDAENSEDCGSSGRPATKPRASRSSSFCWSAGRSPSRTCSRPAGCGPDRRVRRSRKSCSRCRRPASADPRGLGRDAGADVRDAGQGRKSKRGPSSCCR